MGNEENLALSQADQTGEETQTTEEVGSSETPEKITPAQTPQETEEFRYYHETLKVPKAEALRLASHGKYFEDAVARGELPKEVVELVTNQLSELARTRPNVTIAEVLGLQPTQQEAVSQAPAQGEETLEDPYQKEVDELKKKVDELTNWHSNQRTQTLVDAVEREMDKYPVLRDADLVAAGLNPIALITDICVNKYQRKGTPTQWVKDASEVATKIGDIFVQRYVGKKQNIPATGLKGDAGGAGKREKVQNVGAMSQEEFVTLLRKDLKSFEGE